MGQFLLGLLSLFYIGGLLFFLLWIFTAFFHTIFSSIIKTLDDWDRTDDY